MSSSWGSFALSSVLRPSSSLQPCPTLSHVAPQHPWESWALCTLTAFFLCDSGFHVLPHTTLEILLPSPPPRYSMATVQAYYMPGTVLGTKVKYSPKLWLFHHCGCPEVLPVSPPSLSAKGLVSHTPGVLGELRSHQLMPWIS